MFFVSQNCINVAADALKNENKDENETSYPFKQFQYSHFIWLGLVSFANKIDNRFF